MKACDNIYVPDIWRHDSTVKDAAVETERTKIA